MQQTKHYITINDGSNINPVFIKAIGSLIVAHTEVFASATSDESKNLMLEKLWAKNFNSRLVNLSNSSVWDSIEFNDYNAMMMFMLKWC